VSNNYPVLSIEERLAMFTGNELLSGTLNKFPTLFIGNQNNIPDRNDCITGISYAYLSSNMLSQILK
jgi:hypothetical protein